MFGFLESFGVKMSSAFLLSLIPILIWASLIKRRGSSDSSELKKAFLFGVIFVIPILIIQYFWIVEGTNIFTFGNRISDTTLSIAFSLFALGFFTEVAKFLSLANLKFWKVDIKNIHQAILLILAASLGFAFTENAFYFLVFINQGGLENFFGDFVIQSLFITASHMLFSAIVAYYYAIGKFGNPLLAMDNSMGKNRPISGFIKRIFRLRGDTIFQISSILFGLFIAILFNLGFRSMLQLKQTGLAVFILFMAFLVILYLSQKKISYLIFTPEEQARPSKIGEKEKQTVIELMGMWIQEGKYSEVVDICDRLAERDPDDNLVKVIRAKAKDKLRVQKYKQTLKILFSRKKKRLFSSEDKSIFDEYTGSDFRQIPEDRISRNENSLGLVLGGGGIRGCLHLGFYEVLKENGIDVDFITGTSMGAMIGSALALGQSTDVIKAKILAQKDLKAFSFDNFNYLDESILKHKFLRDGVNMLTEGKSFADLKIPFACVAVDLENGDEVVHKSGPLLPAVASSASLPMIFPPVFYRDKYLVDGGIVNNLPCGACRDLGAKKIIAISIKNHKVKQHIAGQVFMRHYDLDKMKVKKKHGGGLSWFLDKKKHDLSLFIDIFMQTIAVAAHCCYEQELSKSKPDLLLEVDCELDLFEFDKIDEAVKIGRKVAEENLEKIKEIIGRK